MLSGGDVGTGVPSEVLPVEHPFSCSRLVFTFWAREIVVNIKGGAQVLLLSHAGGYCRPTIRLQPSVLYDVTRGPSSNSSSLPSCAHDLRAEQHDFDLKNSLDGNVLALDSQSPSKKLPQEACTNSFPQAEVFGACGSIFFGKMTQLYHAFDFLKTTSNRVRLANVVQVEA